LRFLSFRTSFNLVLVNDSSLSLSYLGFKSDLRMYSSELLSANSVVMGWVWITSAALILWVSSFRNSFLCCSDWLNWIWTVCPEIYRVWVSSAGFSC
jgi:hypothetical protein